MEAGSSVVVWFAVAGGLIALAAAAACAIAAAWLTRNAARSEGAFAITHAPPTVAPPPMHVVHGVPIVHPMPTASSPVPTYAPSYPSAPRRPHSVVDAPGDVEGGRVPDASRIVLEGHYPQLGAALGTWLQAERDPIERTRIARDLGRLGDAPSARSLLDGVRTGVLSPTIAGDHLARGGFATGLTVAAALGDPDPRVRMLARSLADGVVDVVQQPHHPERPMPPVPRSRPFGEGPQG